MNLEQWQRSKKIKAEAEAAAKRTVKRVLNAVKEPAMSEFKVGDRIVYLADWDDFDGIMTYDSRFDDSLWNHKNMIRHATEAELAAGQRIDNDMGDDSHIETTSAHIANQRMFEMDKCREEFEKHYLNLPFHDSKAAQKCLDSCDFDVKQNVYIPNAKWFDDNDADEGVIYCCMLNTAYMSFQHQQAKVERAQTNAELLNEALQRSVAREEELQKRVDAALKIIESYTDRKPSEKFDVDTEIDAIYDVEQALKGKG